VKEMGDGAIAIFFTASEAVLCAIDIQKEIQEKEEFSVRMGIHVSEILFTDTDIFGDGVNVASRISGLAEANEICFSNVVKISETGKIWKLRTLVTSNLKMWPTMYGFLNL